MKHRITRKTKWVAMLAAATAGGTVFSPCSSLFHDAAMTSAKAVVYTLLDPDLYTSSIADSGTTTQE